MYHLTTLVCGLVSTTHQSLPSNSTENSMPHIDAYDIDRYIEPFV